MRSQTGLIALALVVASTSPAFAQMKTSAPARAGAAAATPTAGEGVASGDDQFRPTSFLGVERAQVLANGNALMGLGGLNLAMGMGNNLEVGGNAGLNLSASPFSLGIPVGAYGKMLLPMLNVLPNMTAALGASANLTVGTANSFGASVFLPLSFWKLGPGNLHIVPTLGTTSGLGIGYELPVMPKWTLHIGNNAGMTFGATTGFSNALTVGSRVALTPNLTADVGSISLSGTNLSINLLSIGGTFGGRLGDLRSAWGL